jgi:hypothetical protein
MNFKILLRIDGSERIDRFLEFKRFGKVVFICGKERPLMFFFRNFDQNLLWISQPISSTPIFSFEFTLKALQFIGFSTAEKSTILSTYDSKHVIKIT